MQAVSHESDLATLTVSDETFWKGNSSQGENPVQKLTLGQLPFLQDHVNVVGYVAFTNLKLRCLGVILNFS